MPLTQLEIDLENYALDKLHKLMRDVAQAFEVAGLNRGESMPLIAAMCDRASAQIAVCLGCPKQEFMARVSTVFEQEANRHQRRKEMRHGEAKKAQSSSI